MRIPLTELPSVAEIRRRSPEVWKLVDLLNAYRQAHNLPAVPLSPRMTAVAGYHVRDLFEQKPYVEFGSMHSWSHNDYWSGGPFRAGDESTYPVMWQKPREIASYPGNGYEICIRGARDMPHSVDVWKKSPAHNSVILNLDVWQKLEWKALGAVFYQGYACAWFGADKDPG